jgi:hypothetical protein
MDLLKSVCHISMICIRFWTLELRYFFLLFTPSVKSYEYAKSEGLLGFNALTTSPNLMVLDDPNSPRMDLVRLTS